MRGTAAEKFRIFFDPSRFDRPVSSKTSSTFFHYQTMIATENETYQEQHAAFQRQPSPPWLVELRQRGFDAFNRLGIPNKRLEAVSALKPRGMVTSRLTGLSRYG